MDATRCAAGLLPPLDACLAQVAAPNADELLLMPALDHPRWPVRAAAADMLGRRGARQAIPVLRRMLEAEHALAPAILYPAADAPSDGRPTEDLGKRWRLKAALIVALGRLRDRDTVPLLHRLFTDGHDFHAVYSVAAQALGRIGGPEAREVLHLAQAEQEHNTTLRVRAAIEKLERECAPEP
jgi:HEAT repeat protein